MPKMRKDKPIVLNDDQLYAVMRQLHRHTSPKPKGLNKPTGYELKMIREAYDIVANEFWERAEEEHRIDEELKQIAREYDEVI